MEETLVGFQLAKLANKKGFNEICENAFYPSNNGYFPVNFSIKSDLSNYSNYFLRPTQSLLQKWLREKHHIHVEISWEYHMKWFYGLYMAPYTIEDDVISWQTDEFELYDSYEAALENALFEALKLI